MIHSIRTHRRAIAASALLLAMVFILTSVIVIDTDAKTVNQDGMTFSVYDNGTALLVKGEKTPKDLVIPETVISDGQTYTVTGIYQWAFVGSDIETVEIPSTIRNIDNCAFRDCGSLKQVTFSEGLERIGSFCFNDCDMLQTVELPSTLLTLGSKAFAARGLENITVSDSNQAFAVIDGMLVSKDLETLYWYPPNAEQESFTVPSNIYIS